MLLPNAMPTDKSILFFRAITMAEPLSAAPPTIREKHDADENLRHAKRLASAFCRTDEDFTHPRCQNRRADQAADSACHTPSFAFVLRLNLALNAGEHAGMRLEREQQIQSVGEQQYDGDADVEQLLLSDR